MNKINNLHLGSVMLDVLGTSLNADDRKRLLHPLTGGVILFSRNFESPAQLAKLTAEIHALRTPALLIAVDHEGGRVQRFRDGFTAIPPMRELGVAWDKNAVAAKKLAQDTGYVLATELRAHGVDLTFAPVLDVDFKRSSVIGDRAFHADPEIIAPLAQALVHGFNLGGMSSVGKHFPGHGHVRADSHHEVPVDDRSYVDIEQCDLIPFRRLIGAGLGAVMPGQARAGWWRAPMPRSRRGAIWYWCATMPVQRMNYSRVSTTKCQPWGRRALPACVDAARYTTWPRSQAWQNINARCWRCSPSASAKAICLLNVLGRP